MSGNTNDTFTVSITGAEADIVRAFSPSSSIELKVVGEEKVGDSTLRNQELEADITVPRMYRLVPEAIQPTEDLFAGSWVEFTLEVSNLGNTQDAITTGEATIRSCPHLSVSGLEQLENTVVQVTNEKGDNKAVFTLRLEASSSHQERTCEVMLSVQSEGDNAQRSSTFNMAVSAPSTEETNTPDQSDDDDAPILSDSSSLPWLSMTEMLVVFFLAMMALRRGPL